MVFLCYNKCIMDIFDKLKAAYKKVVNSADNESGILLDGDMDGFDDFGDVSNPPTVDGGPSTSLEELNDDVDGDEVALLRSLAPEMQEFVKNSKEPKSSIGNTGCILPIQLLTDKPTATQLITLLGMFRWCMEQSAKGSGGNNQEFTISVKIKNRGGSPLLLSIGDVTIPDIPMEENVIIGN